MQYFVVFSQDYGLYMDLTIYLNKTTKGIEVRVLWGARWIYQVVEMLRVVVISRAVRKLLISGGPLPVPVVPPIALRQGARVAGAPAPTAIDTGRHRRFPSHEVLLLECETMPTRLNLTAQLTPST